MTSGGVTMTNDDRYSQERMTANNKRFNDAEELRKSHKPSCKSRIRSVDKLSQPCDCKSAPYVVDRIAVKAEVRPCTKCGLKRMLSDTLSNGKVRNFCPACNRTRRTVKVG